jgi:hypothetical protein
MKAIVDKLLTGVSSMYKPEGFICEMLLPEIQSKQYSGLLGKYGTNHLRIENSIKGGRGKYRRVETIVRTTTGYNIEGHGLEGMVTKEDYANVEDPFDAERDETYGLSNVLFLEKEKALADTLTSTAIMTANVTLSGTSQFSDYNNSSPIGIVSTGLAALIDQGIPASQVTMAMDELVLNKLRFHPELVDALGYKFQRPGGLSGEELAKAFGIKKILVANARYESAKESQTSSLAAVWGKHIVMGAFPDKAQIMQKSVGYMVRPTGGQPRKVYKQANFNPPGSSAILVEDEYDMLISDALSGYLIKAVIA